MTPSLIMNMLKMCFPCDLVILLYLGGGGGQGFPFPHAGLLFCFLVIEIKLSYVCCNSSIQEPVPLTPPSS